LLRDRSHSPEGRLLNEERDRSVPENLNLFEPLVVLLDEAIERSLAGTARTVDPLGALGQFDDRLQD
jgi:hypothetical protein